MTKHNFPFDESVVHDFIAALAEAGKGAGASTVDQQAANLAAFTAASTAISETYLALTREQIARACDALNASAAPDQAEATFAAMAEAAGQAGTALHAQLLAGIAGHKDKT